MTLYVIPLRTIPLWETTTEIGAALTAASGLWAVNHLIGFGWLYVDGFIGLSLCSILSVLSARAIISFATYKIPTSLPIDQVRAAVKGREAYLRGIASVAPAKPAAPQAPSPLQAKLDADYAHSVRATELAARTSDLTPIAPAWRAGPAPATPPAKSVELGSPEFKAIVQAEIKRADAARLSADKQKWSE